RLPVAAAGKAEHGGDEQPTGRAYGPTNERNAHEYPHGSRRDLIISRRYGAPVPAGQPSQGEAIDRRSEWANTAVSPDEIYHARMPTAEHRDGLAADVVGRSLGQRPGRGVAKIPSAGHSHHRIRIASQDRAIAAGVLLADVCRLDVLF